MASQNGAGPGSATRPLAASLPELTFSIVDGAAEQHAAVPTLRFTLEIESRGGVPIQSVMLTAQIRIDVTRRTHDVDTRTRLTELFGEPERWRETARSLFWTHASVVVPPFEGRTRVALLVPCTYDFE